MRVASASMYAGRSVLPLSSHASMRTTQRACGMFCSVSNRIAASDANVE